MRYYAEDPTIGRSLLLYGEYCHQEIETILSMLDKDSVYVDVGANIGTHSVSIAPHVAHVHAFEPNFENLYLLERNTKSHQNITVYSKAASNHKEFGYTEFNFGKMDRVRVANIISSICTSTNINGRSIGKIQIFNDYSLVDLPRDLNGDVRNKLRNLRIKN